jgi:hypothetical protein
LNLINDHIVAAEIGIIASFLDAPDALDENAPVRSPSIDATGLGCLLGSEGAAEGV